MARWSELELEQPDLASLTERIFAARRLKCLATLRRDGTPRQSEISGAFLRHSEAWLGLIPSAKVADLERDPRCSIHCGSPTDEWGASARISGSARKATPEQRATIGLASDDGRSSISVFWIDVDEVVVTRPDPDSGEILIEWWNRSTGAGCRTRPPG